MTVEFDTGAIELEEFSITNFDGTETQSLKGFYGTLEIYESIFENVIRGQVSIVDTSGIHRMLPIVGRETLTLRFKTSIDSAVFDKKFRVTKLANQTQEGETSTKYTLYFVSPEMVENEKTRVRRSFTNMTAESIVKTLFSELNSERAFVSDPTVGSQRLVVADMKPLQAINMMTTYSRSQKYNGSLFMFFENRDGFNFRTIEGLYDQQSKLTITKESRGSGDTTRSFNSLISYSFDQKFDMLAGISRGMFNSKTIGIDLIAQNFNTFDYDYKKDFDKQQHVDSGTQFVSDDFDETESQMFKLVNSRSIRANSQYFKTNNGTAFSFSKTMEDILPTRISQTQQANFLVGNVSIYGNTDLQCGDVVDIAFPSTVYQDKSKVDQVNDTIDGRYLIRDVRHMLNAGKYTQALTVIKDCYKSQPMNEKS